MIKNYLELESQKENTAFQIKANRMKKPIRSSIQALSLITRFEDQNWRSLNENGKNISEVVKSGPVEVEGLIKNGTMKEVDDDDILQGTHIFGARFVDINKPSSASVRHKNGMVTQYYEDKEAASITTQASIVLLPTKWICCR